MIIGRPLPLCRRGVLLMVTWIHRSTVPTAAVAAIADAFVMLRVHPTRISTLDVLLISSRLPRISSIPLYPRFFLTLRMMMV